jgi:hypothetical protein
MQQAYDQACSKTASSKHFQVRAQARRLYLAAQLSIAAYEKLVEAADKQVKGAQKEAANMKEYHEQGTMIGDAPRSIKSCRSVVI